MGDGMLRVSGSKLIERGEGMGEQAMTQEGIGLPTTFAKCFAALFLCFFYNRERGWIGGMETEHQPNGPTQLLE